MTNPALSPIVAKNTRHLRQLVRRAVQEHGPTVNLNHIDVSGIDEFEALFKGSPFNGDISQWQMNKATNLGRMFEESMFNGDLSRWDVSNVENMHGMFRNSPFNGDVSQWNVENVRWMSYMFCASAFQGDVSLWNTRSLETTNCMFANAPFNGDVSQWSIGRIKDAKEMFNTTTFQQDLSSWSFKKGRAALDGLLHSGFRQGLPRLGEDYHLYYAYQSILHGGQNLDAYARTMPFGVLHAILLLEKPTRCPWADEGLLAWSQTQIQTACSLGLTQSQTIDMLVLQYNMRNEPLLDNLLPSNVLNASV